MKEIMAGTDIAFPNLGIYLENVPKQITIGNFSIALYGIIIACGMLAGIVIASRVAKRTGQNPDIYWDAAVWLIVISVIGARIYYVIFSWDYYKDDLLQIFNLRAGGLAIYGGVIAAILSVIVYCRIKKLNTFLFMDTAGCGLVLGQIIGRWGNFFNREVFGGYSNGPFAMRLPIEAVRQRDITAALASTVTDGTNYIQVHPTFLYEGVWNLCVLLLMLIYTKHKKFDGEVFLLYLFGYGVGRAIIESIRTDQLYLPGTQLPVSLLLGIIMASAALVLDIAGRSRAKKREKA